MIYLYIILAIMLLIFAWELIKAPMGYQDKDGFHKGEPKDDFNDDDIKFS